jgi:energy-coupling factor transporter transmembrane protein EcfT
MFLMYIPDSPSVSLTFIVACIFVMYIPDCPFGFSYVYCCLYLCNVHSWLPLRFLLRLFLPASL